MSLDVSPSEIEVTCRDIFEIAVLEHFDGAPVTPPAAENQKIYDNFSRGTSHSMYASAWPLLRQRKVKTQKSSFGAFGRG